MEWTKDPLIWLAGIYLLMNLVAMAAYGLDKHRARTGGWRISERMLLLLALLGPFGALAGMRRFRHKTRKALFMLVPVFAALHLLLLLALLYH
ncbi:MAG: hypothetical protein A4E29_01102 [Methanomassiliicoccales archaeon PtaB.Bin134]|jgi:uncharacterized membrane protein YsdA (DUF1294 family)|nr:MAG: hypothetical protein A4E29_01102 [Methanomassiliicoccales archaeon PtaB.Bin134]